MDKICRNSQVGQAHLESSFQDFAPDISTTARGSHVSPLSLKLENPDSRKVQRKVPSDTFRSQDFLRHQEARREPPPLEVPQLSPRFWQGASAQSPATSPRSKLRQSKSQKCFSKAPPFATEETPSPAAEKKSPRRARSEVVLPFVSIVRDTSPQGTPFADRSSTANRDRGGSPMAIDGRQGSPRPGSPTFTTSEDWWGYSSTREKVRDRIRDASPNYEEDPTMPSSNFASRARRQHSGRVSQNSENWPFQDGVGAEPAPPVVANIITNIASKGKKVGIHKDEANAKRRLALDASQADPVKREQRRHHFPDNPQTDKHIDGLKVFSPRVLSDGRLSPRTAPPEGGQAGDSKGSRSPILVDVQHRTSPELAATIAPENEEQNHREVASPRVLEPSQRKYIVGNRIVTWEEGRRESAKCMEGRIIVPKTLSQPALTTPATAMKLHRDHRNSDVAREHLQPLQYVEAPTPVMKAITAAGPTYIAVPPQPMLTQAFVRADQRIYCYGDVSSLPSNVPKDTAYMHSGLKVVKYGARQPGAYSPYAQRIPASQVVAGC